LSRRENVPGTIYLLHFDRPLQHARHYVGWTGLDSLDSRIDEHKKGRGSKLMAAVIRAGISFDIARLWHGTRHEERKIKNTKAVGRTLCPICRRGRGLETNL
jgi:hypothetical protein